VTGESAFLPERGGLPWNTQWVVPPAALIAALSPTHYLADAGTARGRCPIGLERKLRVYCPQQRYSLADEAFEDAINDSQALRNFVAIDLSRESVPDATTLPGVRQEQSRATCCLPPH
jgi:hypothetical protein